MARIATMATTALSSGTGALSTSGLTGAQVNECNPRSSSFSSGYRLLGTQCCPVCSAAHSRTNSRCVSRALTPATHRSVQIPVRYSVVRSLASVRSRASVPGTLTSTRIFLKGGIVPIHQTSIKEIHGNGHRRHVSGSAFRNSEGPSSPGKKKETTGEVPLFSGRMAEFVSRTKRSDAMSASGGVGEPENAYRMKEAIRQARERILAESKAESKKKTGQPSKVARSPEPPKVATQTSPPPPAPKPESVKKPEPVKKPDPINNTVETPKAAEAEKAAPSPKAKPASKARATKPRQSRAKAAPKAAEVEAPRTFISGPEGVVAVLEQPEGGPAKEAATPVGKKATRARKVAAVKGAPRPKTVRRRTKSPVAKGEEQQTETSAGAQSEVEGESSAGSEGEGESEGPVLNGARKGPKAPSGAEGNGAVKEKVGASISENGSETGRRKAEAPGVVQEPTLASAALEIPERTLLAQGGGEVVTAEAAFGGGAMSAGGETSTSVAERPETVPERPETEVLKEKGEKSKVEPKSGTETEVLKENGGKSKVEPKSVNGLQSPAAEGVSGEAASSASQNTQKPNADASGVGEKKGAAKTSEVGSSDVRTADEAGADVQKRSEGGKPARAESEARKRKAEKAPDSKNKYAQKKGEQKKDIKDKLASFRGGSLVDRVIAAPKVYSVLAAASSSLDTPTMVKLLKDLSGKETAVKKPGLTAKAFSWLRKNKAPLDPLVYLVALEIFAADANFAAAQEAVDDMAEHKVRRSPEHLAHLIAAYQAAGRPREAADVIAAAADVTPDTTSFNAALKACVEGRLGAERVLEVYASMQAAGAAETAETYAYVIDQCLLAEGTMPAAGWVSEKMREKGFNLDRVGARVVEKLLDQERVDEAWERFINWKPAKGRWSSVLYEKMLEGLLNKNLVEDVGLHVSEMQRHKIGISSTLWPRVRAIGNPYASVAEARLKALEAASGPGPAAPAAVTDSKPAETSEAQRVEAVKEGVAKVKGPLHALSESLVNRAASQSKISESLVNKPASESSESLVNKPASESSESFVNKATKRLNMKEVWTPKGRFFTGPKVVPGEATEASSQGGAAGQGVPSSSAPQGGAAEPSSRGGASSSAPPGGVQGGASSSARTGAVSERPAGGVPASGTDVPGELEPYWKLIQVQLQKGRVEGAAETLADVQHMGLVPTASMYKELVVACAKKGLKDTAWGLIRQMQESGHIPTPDLFEALR